ncbi:hypothetical protein ACP70R_015522 [Stipagrostis hirtigluma subsp. patula]
MGYWKSKLLPQIRLLFVKTGGKKAAAAAELVKNFDDSKEGINGEFEAKKADLQPKIVEIYESAPAPLKVLIKERSKVSGIKKNSAAITKFFEDLAKIGSIPEFPGAKQVSEGIATVGPALLSGPIFATFEKVATLLPAAAEEDAPKEAPAAAAEEKKEEAAGEKKEEGEEEKKEEAPAAAAAAEEAAAGESAPPAAAAAEPAAAEETSAAPAVEGAAPAEPESSEPGKAEEETPKA